MLVVLCVLMYWGGNVGMGYLDRVGLVFLLLVGLDCVYVDMGRYSVGVFMC